MMRNPLSLRLIILWMLCVHAFGEPVAAVGVTSPPATVRRQLKLDAFYEKYLDASGVPLVASGRVSDAALREGAFVIRQMMTKRQDLLKTMADHGVYIVVMAHNEYTTDLPEQRDMQPKLYWDRRARGLGGIPVSCGEENLLAYPGDPYREENILIHEFAHSIHRPALSVADPTFDERLAAAYDKARAKGLWEGTYAATNRSEYWAEGVQCWFDNNRENDASHGPVNTRSELKAYDPELAGLCEEILGDGPWRYLPPTTRPESGRRHLEGFDPKGSPTFQWRRAPVTDKPCVRLITDLGEIDLELNAEKAPVTVRNFLRYVHEGHYKNGVFFRAVREGNQTSASIKIAVIQAQADPSRATEAFAPIVLERTRDTGLRHQDGAVSMARLGPDTGTHHFFICIGDQPELDFGGQRNPDGQGFAVFGRVIRGMELVRRIHHLPADGEILESPVQIQAAIRME